jgi:flavin reductase (DIM6/NTAB) family NADH-FMN oxidoreductase RutF
VTTGTGPGLAGDRDDYDALMADADTTLVVVTAAYRGERAGCLVGFQCQCSIEPARHAIWLSKANHTCRVALQASHLGVHFLDRADHELARRFGEQTGDEIDKFDGWETIDGPDGVPLLVACPDRLVGRRRTAMDDGSDHICFVVEPIEVQRARRTRDPMRVADAADLTAGHAAEERASET